MPLVADGLAYGWRFRCLNVVDDYTRECLVIEVNTSLPDLRVQQALERLKEMRGLPASITVDNGPEFAGKVGPTKPVSRCLSIGPASRWRSLYQELQRAVPR
nr:DDE-type integrase/transposase/recombinase [Burkholderia ambifaria]